MDRRLLMLALGMFALGTDSFVVAGVLPQVAHAFGVPIGAAAQMTTVYAIAYALMAPTIAAVAAHMPRKTLLLSALSVFVIANLAVAVAPSFALALVARAIAGVSAAMFAPTATGSAATLVPPEKRGFALSVVIAGLTGATALGSPIGAVIGGLGDWRWTMVFVSAIGATSGLGILLLLANIPLPPKVSLAARLTPIADPRIALTLACTLLYMTGIFMTYTYFTLVFDRVLGGNTWLEGGLLVLWGFSGTVGNLLSGRLADSIGNRKVILGMLIVLAAVMAAMPWAGANLWSAMLAIAVWGAVGWGLLASQQHRLVSVASHTAPVVLGLNTSCTYLGVTVAGILGAVAIRSFDPHDLGYICAGFVLLAIVAAEWAAFKINNAQSRETDSNVDCYVSRALSGSRTQK